MVNGGRQQLHHRTVNNGNSDSSHSVLPTTTSISSSSSSNAKDRRNFRGILRSYVVSRKSTLTLMLGMLIGYSIVPIFMLQLGPLNGTVEVKEPITDDRKLAEDDIMTRLIENKKLLSTQSLPTDRTPYTMTTPILSDQRRKKILVTGGAGFVGSHLVDKLMMEGHEVTVVDNFFTGQKKNVAHWMHHPNFRYGMPFDAAF